MNKQRRIFSWALVLILALTCYLLSGCGQTETGNPEVNPQENATQAEDQENVEEEGQTERIFVDDAGREVTVPIEVNKVFSTNHMGTMLVHTVNPDKLAAWNGELRPGEMKYFPEKNHGLPALGSWSSGSTSGMEDLLAVDPDVIISANNANVFDQEFVESLQEQTNIPIVLINVDLNQIDHTYARMGELMNEKEATECLAEYGKKAVAEIKEKAKQVSEEERIRVYCAFGTDGLRTAQAGSNQSQILEMINGLNVAEVDSPLTGTGMIEVSLEQVLQWDPEVIICWSSGQGGYFTGVTTEPDWKNITAVKNNRVYEIPDVPASWFSNPPSVNRIIGLKWAGKLLYPEIFDYDLIKEAKEFYDLFYHYKLTDEEAAELLENAL